MNLEEPSWTDLAFIDARLTSIKLPTGITIIKHIKKECMLGCQRFLFGRRGDEERNELSREEVTDVVLSNVEKVNTENLENRYIKIKKSFDICEVNP